MYSLSQLSQGVEKKESASCSFVTGSLGLAKICPLNCDDGGLLPDTSSGKRQLISDHMKGPLVAAFRSPLMKALDRSVETLVL